MKRKTPPNNDEPPKCTAKILLETLKIIGNSGNKLVEKDDSICFMICLCENNDIKRDMKIIEENGKVCTRTTFTLKDEDDLDKNGLTEEDKIKIGAFTDIRDVLMHLVSLTNDGGIMKTLIERRDMITKRKITEENGMIVTRYTFRKKLTNT